MGQQEFVSDRRDDDAGDDEEVNVGVEQARVLARIVGFRDAPAAGLRAGVEVDLPERDAAHEGDDEGRDAKRV